MVWLYFCVCPCVCVHVCVSCGSQFVVCYTLYFKYSNSSHTFIQNPIQWRGESWQAHIGVRTYNLLTRGHDPPSTHHSIVNKEKPHNPTIKTHNNIYNYYYYIPLPLGGDGDEDVTFPVPCRKMSASRMFNSRPPPSPLEVSSRCLHYLTS